MTISGFFGKEFHANITLCGVANAGKTTLLHRLKGDKEKISTEEVPTIGVNIEKLEVANSKFLAIDMGGQEGFAQVIWEPYCKRAMGVIFVFDSAAEPEVIKKSGRWVKKVGDWLDSETIFLFLANKCDLPNSLGLNEVIDLLDLTEIMVERRHTFAIYRISALTGEGFEEAWSWFTDLLLTKM